MSEDKGRAAMQALEGYIWCCRCTRVEYRGAVVHGSGPYTAENSRPIYVDLPAPVTAGTT